ncbi:probable transcriptional regulator SLK2 isoform X1 [Tanacetum coccineum]
MSESSRIYRGKEIMIDMNARFKIDISYSQAWRAKCYALQLLRGTPQESFAELPFFLCDFQVSQMLEVAQKWQSTVAESGSDGVSQQDLQTSSNMLVTAGRQLARSLDLQSLNDLGFTKRYVRSLQIALIEFLDTEIMVKLFQLECEQDYKYKNLFLIIKLLDGYSEVLLVIFIIRMRV